MRPLDMTRDTVRAIIFLFLFALLLGAANLIFTAHEIDAIRSSVTTSQRAAASVAQLCEAGNEARAQQAGLWAYLIHLSPPPPDAAGRARLVKFETHLEKVFAARNCQHIPR